MKRLITVLSISILVPTANAAPITPKYDAACTFEAVALKMNVVVREDIPLPKVILASEISIKEFQDLAEGDLGMRPEMVSNMYSPTHNIIFLMNESTNYKSWRFIEDSLAHELVHYVQVKYRGEPNSDEAEWEADRIQTWFREVILPSGQSPCAPKDAKVAQLN